MPTVRAASVRVVRQTCGVDIEITTDFIRLGQLLKYANLVADGAEAKSQIAAGGVRVDGEPENRRGRQVSVGSVVEVDLPGGPQQVRVVAEASGQE